MEWFLWLQKKPLRMSFLMIKENPFILDFTDSFPKIVR